MSSEFTLLTGYTELKQNRLRAMIMKPQNVLMSSIKSGGLSSVMIRIKLKQKNSE